MPLTEALEAQGRLEPREPGWWQVWGASARHIQPGDLLMVKWAADDDAIEEIEVIEVEDHLCGKRILRSTGKTAVIGHIQPIRLFRQGTKHTLAR